MTIWHNDDYTVTVRRESREDRPYVVTDTLTNQQWWHSTLELAMSQAITTNAQYAHQETNR